MDGWRSWSCPSSAKARKEVKLGLKLEVWCEPSSALFSPFCGKACHASSRGWVRGRHGLRAGLWQARREPKLALRRRNGGSDVLMCLSLAALI